MVKLTYAIVIISSTIFSIPIKAVILGEIEIRRVMYESQRENEKALLREVIQSKQNPNKKIKFSGYPEYPLVLAAREGYLTELKQLLEYGADPNLGCPLHEAVEDHVHIDYFKCASSLLDYGADPDRKKYNKYQEQIDERIIIKIIAQKNQFFFDQNDDLKPKYTNKSYKQFIERLLQRTNPYLVSRSGEDLIKLIQKRIKRNSKNIFELKEATDFYILLLQEFQTMQKSTFAPKSLKELAMRKVITNNLHNTYKNSLPIELQEEAEQYSKRKDMTHLIKKWQ